MWTVMAGRVAWKDLVEAKGRDRKVELRMARESIVMQVSGGGVACGIYTANSYS